MSQHETYAPAWPQHVYDTAAANLEEARIAAERAERARVNAMIEAAKETPPDDPIGAFMFHFAKLSPEMQLGVEIIAGIATVFIGFALWRVSSILALIFSARIKKAMGKETTPHVNGETTRADAANMIMEHVTKIGEGVNKRLDAHADELREHRKEAKELGQLLHERISKLNDKVDKHDDDQRDRVAKVYQQVDLNHREHGELISNARERLAKVEGATGGD